MCIIQERPKYEEKLQWLARPIAFCLGIIPIFIVFLLDNVDRYIRLEKMETIQEFWINFIKEINY